MSDSKDQYDATKPHVAKSIRSDEVERQIGEVDPIYEAKLVRKLDLHIIPVVMLLYLLSFLDRVNIGNARLYGLEEDLGLNSSQFQIVVSILFVTYILSELPSNLVLKKLRPSRWIAFITVAWGIIATLTGTVKSFGGMIACRLLLGAVEGGLFPGMAVYLTFFYTKRELALRIGYLFVSSALAGACGGLLAYGIGHMDGVAGQRGWRWIMIIEGIPTFCLGVATWWILPDNPESAYFLNDQEKAYAAARLKRQTGYTKQAAEFHWDDVKKCFKDWKVWLFCFAQFGSDTMLYGFSTFLPTIIKAIMPKASSALVQVLTIPCYATGAITYLIVARFSDKQQKRGMYSVLLGVISIVGYAMLISPSSSGVHYAGCFLVAMGLYVCVGLPLAWLPTNLPRYGKRTSATGLQLTIGNCAGIMSSFLYPTKEGPRFIKGHAVTMAMVAFAITCYAVMWFHLGRLNSRREKGEEEHLIEGMSDEEIAELGDDSPRFRYTV
ncbi:high-affinity nicotinic acid transporter-like protein [Dothidotthia symphoricarpi CBS 119687]|uniref:High-affinity nicotinic acid transporter-like protein n=1 Tax=Dothidotthia symphoricarpi CBS 119687 TaxID=1392245 RepID=A0A6A6AGL1_9PLEO|nr:high-affinity nicotinic acid transporter-like protein [Dothidotthia symphoricarpi CBS 119687]KAF2130037.1 high-affinity nicotinic acid transporter-like protein [Dothidotthia symphoricarpi CBS 119687]